MKNPRGEHAVPYTERKHRGATFRNMNSIEAANFPKEWLRTGDEGDLRELNYDDSREKYELLKMMQQSKE